MLRLHMRKKEKSIIFNDVNILLFMYFIHCVYVYAVFIAQLCLTLCNPRDCSLPGPSVHGILLARVPKWVAMPFSRGSSQPRDPTQVSSIAGRFFNTEPSGKPGLPTPIFLPGEFHGQRGLAGYNPWGHKELDTTERLTLSVFNRVVVTVSEMSVMCLA